jgi:gas vesicle protein
MSDAMKAAWDEVGDSFATLAKLVRERYRAADGEAETGSGGPTRPVDGDADQEAAAKFRKALDSLMDAARDLSDRASGITHSEEIRSQARQAGTSLNSALSKTVDALMDDLSDLFKTVKSEWTEVVRRVDERPGSTPDASVTDTSGTEGPATIADADVPKAGPVDDGSPTG